MPQAEDNSLLVLIDLTSSDLVPSAADVTENFVRSVRLGRRLEQPLEAGVALERGEAGVDPKPARREQVGDPEQRLQLVEGLLRLTYQEVDAHQLVLIVGAVVGILADRHQREALFP